MAYISRHPEIIHLDEREKYDVQHIFSKTDLSEKHYHDVISDLCMY